MKRKQLPSKSNLQVIVFVVRGAAVVPVTGLDETSRKSCAQGDPAVDPVGDHSSFFLPTPFRAAHRPPYEI